MNASPPAPLDAALYRETVRRALAEDLGWGDATTHAIVPTDIEGQAMLTATVSCVICGLDLVEETFRQLDPGSRVHRLRRDGDTAAPGDPVARIEGRVAWMLTAERTARNFLERLTGLATLTRRAVDAAAGRLVVVTRETTPTLRALEHYAARAGGARIERASLDEGVLISTNHVRLAGGVTLALARTRDVGREMPVEVVVTSPDEADEAVAAGASRVRVEGVDVARLAAVAERVQTRAQVIAAGAASIDDVRALAASGAHVVALGALMDSASCVRFDFSLAWPT